MSGFLRPVSLLQKVLRPLLAAAFAAALVAGTTVPSDAVVRHHHPAPHRHPADQVFDGLWSVLIMTEYGFCDRGYRYPLRIVRGRIVKADSDPSYQVAGAVTRSGAIGVSVAAAGQVATGFGRLSGNYGSGRWRTGGGECAGVWTATRRG